MLSALVRFASPGNSCLGWWKCKQLFFASKAHIVVTCVYISKNKSWKRDLTILSSVQSLVVSYCLWPHGLQHARPPCPSPTPRVYSNSCSLSQWCHPIISSSVVPFSCLQSCPAQGLFKWVSSSHQVAKLHSFSFSISPSNEY